MIGDVVTSDDVDHHSVFADDVASAMSLFARHLGILRSIIIHYNVCATAFRLFISISMWHWQY